MSDTNQVSLRYVKETTEGDIPSSPVFKRFRYTGAPNFGLTPQTVESEEIRGDQRDVADLILVGFEVGAEATAELLWGAHDDLWEAALFSIFRGSVYREGSSQVTDITTDVVTVTDESATQGSFSSSSVVFMEGFDDAANNGVFEASAGGATSVTLSGLVDDATPAADAEVHEIGLNATITAITAPSGGASTITATGIGTAVAAAFGVAVGAAIVGGWIKVGSTSTASRRFAGGDAGYNDVVRVASITDADNIVVNRLPTTWPAGPFAGSQACWIVWGKTMTNGNVRHSFTLEAGFLDHTDNALAASPTYGYTAGALLNTWELNLTPQSIATLASNFFGSLADWSEQGATSPFLTQNGSPVQYNGAGADPNRVPGATNAEVDSTTPLNTSSNVARLSENGTVIQALGKNAVLEMTMSFNNNLRRRTAVGVAGAAGIGTGSFVVTGNLGTYFDDPTLVRAAVRNLETSIDVVMKDNASNYLVADMPRVKYTSGNPPVAGRNQDTNLPLTYQAILEATLGHTIRVQTITAEA